MRSDPFVHIESIVTRPVGRGAEAFLAHTSGQLRRAAESLLAGRPDVAILTGFFVGSAAETDGPVGAVQLAAALRRLGGAARKIGRAHV